MEILGRVGGLANLEIVACGQLQVTLDASAGVLWSLAFVAVREKHDDAGEQSPLVFTSADELVENRLSDVGKISKLRFPQNQCFRIIASIAVFKAEHAGL